VFKEVGGNSLYFDLSNLGELSELITTQPWAKFRYQKRS
jgi:hypothetical protein